MERRTPGRAVNAAHDSESLASIGEDELVRRLTQNLPLGADVIAGAGDDCAVLRSNRRGDVTLFKTDCVVEGVHFNEDTPAVLVGRKALARVISDIAAMGGTPQHAVITLILPPQTSVLYVEELYSGLNDIAQRFGVAIVGGETSRGPLVIISISMTGKARAKAWVGRNGAKTGDCIYVTGRLGGSLKGHHLSFEPRVAEAQWLVKNFRIHAMMDISDGLVKDLPRMAKSSGVSFTVEDHALPANEGCTAQQAWSDGEDYELLFAVSPRTVARLESGWSQHFPGLQLTCIGRFVGEGKGRALSFMDAGWEHFSGTRA